MTNNESKLKKYIEYGEYNVFILGHSCGISDSLILQQILTDKKIHKIIPFYHMNNNGYFDTMVNIDRIIDDYSKTENKRESFNKLITFPDSYKMPQTQDDKDLIDYLKKILNEKFKNDYSPHR